MIQAIMNAISMWVYSDNPAILIGASLIWGIISILFSPCHLTGIPLMVGYMGGNAERTTRQVWSLSLMFAAAVFLSIIVIGFITGALGMMLGNLGWMGEAFLILVLIYFGLAIIDVLPFPPMMTPSTQRKGITGMFISGLAFGTGLGPCTFAYMAPVLGVVLQTFPVRPILGTILVLAFGIGHCATLAFLGVFFDRLSLFRKGVIAGVIMKRIAAVILVLYGLYRLAILVGLVI